MANSAFTLEYFSSNLKFEVANLVLKLVVESELEREFNIIFFIKTH